MWIQWLGIVLLLAVVCHSGARLAVAGRGPAPASRASDAAHVLMCAGLIAMLVPWGDPIPTRAWEVVFSLVVAWSLVATLRGPQPRERLVWARHAVAGIAMVFMFAAAPVPMSGMNAAMGWPGGLPGTALAWILVAFFGCCALWFTLTAAGVELRGATPAVTAARPGAGLLRTSVLAPRATSLGEAVMAACMAGMLLAMR
jgi:hypothetical protein